MKWVASACLAVALVLAANVAAASTDIFDAVRAGDVEKVKALLQADPKLAEARTEDGSTALHLAALEGHADIARLLLASGAQVNARGLREETPLHMAMYDGHRTMAELLLASQADVNAQNTSGETPLHLAARKGHRELVALLLEHHADVNAKDRQDATPLHAAAGAGHSEVVELLLSQNADLLARDKSGRTPKAAAAEKDHGQTVELLTPRVGGLYDLQRLVFEGTNTFSAEALRRGLKNAPGLSDAAHPLAPLDALLEAIQQKLLLGYQHHGFPDAQVGARHDAKAGRIVVKVMEGPRYLCGEVKVTGAKQARVAEIVQRLTVSRPAATSAQQAFDFKDKAPGANPLITPVADESQPEEAPWIKGEPAPFSHIDLRRMQAQVTDVLREQGFLLAKANVLVVPDKTARTAELQVEILAEGPRAVIDRLEVSGNKKNSTEAVLRYLDLKPGMTLSSQLIDTIQDRLWRAARFLTNSVKLGAADADGRVALQLEVAEYDDAPPLGQEFSPTEQGMLKLRDWLAKVDQSGEELILTGPGSAGQWPATKAVLSPRHGLVLLATDAAGNGAGPDEYAAIFKASQACVYAPISGRKLLLQSLKAQVEVNLAIESRPESTNVTPFGLTLSAGIHSQSEDVTNCAGYRFEVALPPVACIGFAHRWDCSSWFDGDVLIRSNATLLLKINARTGRLLEFRHTSEEGGRTIELRCEKGAFDPAVRRVEAGASGLPNCADTNAPFSSAVAFLAEEAASSKYLEPLLRTNSALGQWAGLPRLLRQFRLEYILAPLNRLAEPTNGPAGSAGEFVIPVDLDSIQPTPGGMMALLADWLVRKSDGLFAPRSWPWTLLREACFVVEGKSRYGEQALKEVCESGETGPVGCLVLSQLLGRVQPALGKEFAVRGLSRLSVADFRHDCDLFLAGDSIASQCCQRLATALRDLDPAQLDALVKQQSPARAEFIRDCVRRLQVAKDRPVIETLAPTLEAYWKQELKEQVAAALSAQGFDAARVFKEGLTAYQTMSLDKSQAAKLFAQAAAHGHAGAQYYLGMIYEKGAGVPKDFAGALNWYRQSATNGYGEAAAALGNFYNDGLAVEQDYAEAFVWYSVAAARGNRVAEVFRNSAQRKLSVPQLTAARKKVAALLAAMPPAGDTTPPPDAER